MTRKEKIEVGDLICEELGDSFYLIVITSIKGNEGHGYLLDDTSFYEEDDRLNPIPYHTLGDDESGKYSIDLDDVEIIEKSHTTK